MNRALSTTSTFTITGLAVPLVAYFVTSFLIRGYLDRAGVPRTMMRRLVVFVLAIAAGYGAGFLAEQVVAWS